MTALEQTLTHVTELADALERRAASSTPKTIQEWQRYRKDTFMLVYAARDFVAAASRSRHDVKHTLIDAQQVIQDLEEALQDSPGGMQA
jgi:predicted nucleic acid-binding protein